MVAPHHQLVPQELNHNYFITFVLSECLLCRVLCPAKYLHTLDLRIGFENNQHSWSIEVGYQLLKLFSNFNIGRVDDDSRDKK
jgi:hypothetical protein